MWPSTSANSQPWMKTIQVFIEKNLDISRPMLFKPVLFKDQLYNNFVTKRITTSFIFCKYYDWVQCTVFMWGQRWKTPLKRKKSLSLLIPQPYFILCFNSYTNIKQPKKKKKKGKNVPCQRVFNLLPLTASKKLKREKSMERGGR